MARKGARLRVFPRLGSWAGLRSASCRGEPGQPAEKCPRHYPFAMADHGQGRVLPYVGSRLASFTLLYVTVMRERLRPLQAVGLGLCLLGLAMLCLPQ